jgi:DNA invertase Pin-like site-specific DNA recombinase
MPTNLPLDGYIRVSRVAGRSGESFISPDVQRETIARLAAIHGLEVGEIVEELDTSGKIPIDRRELGRLVRKAEAGESGGLLVWKVSRFSRSLLDGVTVAERVRDAGGRIIGEDLDSSAPMGRAILGFLLGWAEEELDARRIGWRTAQERAAARGAYIGRTPVGYVRGENQRLEPDPVAGPAITALFTMRASGSTLAECAAELARVTGKEWSRAAVSKLFHNPAYLGRIAIGDIYQDDTHEALTDERTWTLAQRTGRRQPRDGSLAAQGVLAGFIRCAGCGFVCSVTASGSKEKRVASYSCAGRRVAGVCPAPASAAVYKVDGLVLPRLEAYKASHERTFSDYLAAVDLSAAAYEGAVQELDAFLEAALVSELGRERYAREVARRREAVEAARAIYEADHVRGSALLGTDETTGLEHDRAVARTLLESVTLSKSTQGRWQPIEERVDLVWRA